MTNEELDMFIDYLWREEIERRIEGNGVLKELHEEQKELSNEQD